MQGSGAGALYKGEGAEDLYRGSAVQRGPMHHRQWSYGTPTVNRQTHLKTLPPHNFVGGR